MISATGVTKRFGDFVALDDVSLDVPEGSLTALLGPSGSGKSTLLRIIAGLEAPDAGEIAIDGRGQTRVPARKREIGFVFQHYAAFKHMTVRDNVAFGLTVRKRPKAEIAASASTSCSASSGSPATRTATPRSSRAASASGWRSRARSPCEPRVLLLDEPFGALDANVRAELRAWLRRLHEEVPVTTVIVTHDQEEAMEIADRIAVMSHGRIEQVGSPRELYEQPANDFVMSFLGPVSELGGRLVRPHDLRLTAEPRPGASEAMVARVVHLGFEVRVELVLADGAGLRVQITRGEAEELELNTGDLVWVAPDRPQTAALDAVA